MRKYLIFILTAWGAFFVQAQITAKTIKAEVAAIYADFDQQVQAAHEKNLPLYDKYLAEAKTPESQADLRKQFSSEFARFERDVAVADQVKFAKMDSLIFRIERERPLVKERLLPEGSDPLGSYADVNSANKQIQNRISADFPFDYFVNRAKRTGKKLALLTTVRFSVDANGEMRDIDAVGKDPEFDRMAVLFFYELDMKIRPTLQGNRYVSSVYRIPMGFNISY